jgi:hypothetical protein
MTERERLAQLLAGLATHGFTTILNRGEDAVVRDADGEEFALFASDQWVQAGQKLVDAEALRASLHASDAHQLALRLNSRFLGCRFALDDEENLCVLYDVYPDLAIEHVARALKQLAAVARTSLPLFEEVLGSDPN